MPTANSAQMTSLLMPLIAVTIASGQSLNPGVPIEESYLIGAISDHAAEREPRPLAMEPTPFTIEPGRLAIELDLINFVYDRHNPDRANERVRSFQWPLLFRYGLTDNLEMRFGIETYARETVRDRDAGTRETADGFGDLTIGAKYNLWGNDDWDRDVDGATALAVLPYLRLPTNRHGLTSRAVEGGVLVPFAMELPADFEFYWVPGFSAVRNSNDDGYTFEWSSLVTLEQEFLEGLSWYVEFESFLTAESGNPWIGQINTGLTWEITDDTILEFGTSFGVTRSADDFGFYISFVQRF